MANRIAEIPMTLSIFIYSKPFQVQYFRTVLLQLTRFKLQELSFFLIVICCS